MIENTILEWIVDQTVKKDVFKFIWISVDLARFSAVSEPAFSWEEDVNPDFTHLHVRHKYAYFLPKNVETKNTGHMNKKYAHNEQILVKCIFFFFFKLVH